MTAVHTAGHTELPADRYAMRIDVRLRHEAGSDDSAAADKPIEARIMAVVDAYKEALCRRAADICPEEAALLEMRMRASTGLDAEVVDALLSLFRADALADLERMASAGIQRSRSL